MNGSLDFVRSFCKGLSSSPPPGVQAVLCPPSVYMAELRAHCAAGPLSHGYSFGGQDLSLHASGPHTGEVSGAMLRDIGCTYVIIGHGERQEACSVVAHKLQRAREAGLCPLVCVGESTAGDLATLAQQCRHRLQHVTQAQGHFLVAYEPVWAIGAAEPPSATYVASALACLRTTLQVILGGAGTPVLYGGAVSAAFFQDVFPALHLQGILLGRASLSPAMWEQFLALAGHLVDSGAVT